MSVHNSVFLHSHDGICIDADQSMWRLLVFELLKICEGELEDMARRKVKARGSHLPLQ